MVLKKLFGSYISVIVEKIDLYSPPCRQREYSTKYCLKQICRVLKTGIPWSSLKTVCHFTTVYKRFVEWNQNNVFDIIWRDILKEYSGKQLSKDPKWANVLLIDSTMIKNIAGSDSLGKNHFDRSRLATKQSIICDVNKVPLSCLYYGANVHDARTIEDTIKGIACKYKPDKRYKNTIVGDKGYILNPTKKRQILQDYKMKIVTPYRYNQMQHVTKRAKQLLTGRYKVEHVFCRLDKFKRLHCRVDRFVVNYKAFNLIAMTSITINAIKAMTM